MRRLNSYLAMVPAAFLLAGCGGNYTSQVTQVTGTTVYIDPAAAQRRYQGLSKVVISPQGVLDVTVIERLYAPEREAPVLTTKQIEGKRANPVGSALATGLTAGLYPLLLPRQFFKDTFGHQTSEQVLNTQPDTSKAKNTGRFEWVTLPYQSARVTVTGLPTKDPIVVNLNARGEGSLDLSRQLFIANQTSKVPISLEITCVNCSASAPSDSVRTTQSLRFHAPAAWGVLADYYRSNQVLWLSDRGLVGDSDSTPRKGSETARSWRDFSDEVSRRISAVLKSKQELPAELRRERADLSRNKPAAQVTLTRDEFESTAAFNERVRLTRENERRKIEAYNRRVDLLNDKIRRFQEQAPRQLPNTEVANIMSTALSDLVGDPQVKSATYDADLEQFVVTVGGYSQPAKAPIQFLLISQNRIPPSQARVLKDVLTQSRPLIRLGLTGQTIQPVSAHLVLDKQVLEMQFVDGFELPRLQTVQLDAAKPQQVEALTRIAGGAGPAIMFADDPESQQLRRQLETLRQNLQQRQQAVAERSRLTNEIRELETRLKQIDEGDFKDDLLPRINALPVAATSTNIHAIVVGIASYSELPNVVFADRSASLFAEAIRRRFGIDRDQITTLLNEEATGTRLLARIKSISNRLGPNDQLIFYFAGHGAPSQDGRNTVLIPQDASAEVPVNPELSLQSIYQILTASKAQHVWAILESCFSGRADNNQLIYKDVAPVLVTPKAGLMPPNPQRLSVLAAGGPNDFANAMRSTGHRLFTYHLLNHLSQSQQITPGFFGTISERVAREAAALGPAYTQRPVWMGQDRPFGIKP